MPKSLKCDWDRCIHHNLKTHECTNPDEVKFSTVVAVIGSIKDVDLFTCSGYVDFEEGEAK